MKSILQLAASAAIILALLAICGCRAQHESASQARSLTGILCVTGNEPFTELSLQTADGRMHVIQRDTTAFYRSLRGSQGKRLRVQFRLPETRSDSSLIIVNHYDLVTDR